MADRVRRIVYVTANRHKREECKVLWRTGTIQDGQRIRDIVAFEFRSEPVLQILEVDIEKMVRAGVARAYSEIKVPCIVEYAGLIFESLHSSLYPGGLTKAMWNALKDKFLDETHSIGRKVIARAVIGFCDGKKILAFTGETGGRLKSRPRGARDFYWDTVFVPDKSEGGDGRSTYSEIVAKRGLRYKMDHLSQSAKAMRKLVEYLSQERGCGLWR